MKTRQREREKFLEKKRAISEVLVKRKEKPREKLTLLLGIL